jgi:hypothetical protein
LWVPYLLWRRRWQAAAWLVTVALGANLLPNLISTPDYGGWWARTWLDRYLMPMTATDHCPGKWESWIVYNQSLAGAANRWLSTSWQWKGEEFEVVNRPGTLSPMTVKWVVYSTAALLILAAVVVMMRRPTSTALDHGAHVGSDVLEWCMILSLMVLLSPMSSKPHFSTLILPGFCLARLAVYEGGRLSRAVMALAAGLMILSLPCWGQRVDFIGLWNAAETWNAIVLFLGCWWALWRQSFVGKPES